MTVRRIELTEGGVRLAPRITELPDQLQQAYSDMSGPATEIRLTISLVASFGSRWLVPRLGAFMQEHAGLEVNLPSNSGFTRSGGRGCK